jgi:chromosome segregation ATPase
MAEFEIRNIGGINETVVTFEPGVTVLAGRNATNRTSLLQAVMAAFSSEDVSIKADAEEAYVELTLDDSSYTRTLERRNGTVVTGGNPYLEDPTVADLFAFLLESNGARRAVVTDGDLREIIMRPIDAEEIRSEIDRLLKERRQVNDELDELDDLKDRLPSLEEKRTRLESQIEDKQGELETLETNIEAADANVGQGQKEQAELESKLDELREKRSELEDVRYELETEQDSLESLRAEKREVEDDYEALPETSTGDVDKSKRRIDQLRTRKQELESELNELQNVIGFNQERLDSGTDEFIEALEEDSETVTDDLLSEETVTCLTCGSEVKLDQIETTIETLQDLSQETVGEINDLEDDLEEVKIKRRERRNQQRERERLERRQQELGDGIKKAETRIETLSERREELRGEIEIIESEVDALEDDAYEEILNLHRKANQLEYDLGTLENDLERVEGNIATIEGRLDEESALETRREEVDNEIKSLRTKIERIERQAIEEFNEHMETMLETLEYDNLARIWLERTETEVREGRRKRTRGVFDLHIIRQTDSGATYEDRVENLSESEREVTGLVFALAGYLAHEVHETVPFMLLDSLEAIDSERIETLVEYLAEYSEYLVVALLPEDAQEIEDDYRQITEI